MTITPGATAADRRGFERFREGDEADLGSVEVREADVVRFASAWDPQPFHLDAEAGRASPLGGHAASGWHTAAMLMRLLVDNFLSGVKSMGSGQIRNLKWLKPVLVGDRLSARCRVTSIRASTRGDRGYVETDFTVANQRGEPVLTMSATLIVGR